MPNKWIDTCFFSAIKYINPYQAVCFIWSAELGCHTLWWLAGGWKLVGQHILISLCTLSLSGCFDDQWWIHNSSMWILSTAVVNAAAMTAEKCCSHTCLPDSNCQVLQQFHQRVFMDSWSSQNCWHVWVILVIGNINWSGLASLAGTCMYLLKWLEPEWTK